MQRKIASLRALFAEAEDRPRRRASDRRGKPRVDRSPNPYLLDVDGRPQRARCRRFIRHLAEAHDLAWLRDQLLRDFGAATLRDLDDDALYLLALDLEEAKTSLREGIDLEEAGLPRRL